MKKKEKNPQQKSLRGMAAIGPWKNREDMTDPVAYVRNMREGRPHVLDASNGVLPSEDEIQENRLK